MAYTEQVGTSDIRTIVYDKAIRALAAPAYKFKQALTISPTSAWKNYFYREDPSVLAGATGNATKGLPRGAAFPQAVVSWEKVQSVIVKYGLEDNIMWEDILSDDLDVRDRTLFKIAEGVTKAVDDEIWDTLTESRVVTNIQSITLTKCWDESSAAIIDNLLEAKQKIAEYNYDTSNLMAFVSPKDYRRIMNYLAEKGAQFPKIGEDVATNGRQGTLAGIQLVVSNSVTASYALVVVPKVVGTWKEMVPLQTVTKEDPFKSVTVRAVEMGITQLSAPKCAVLIKNTQLVA